MRALAGAENRLGVNQHSPSHSCEDRRCALVRTFILNFYSELLFRTRNG